MGCTAINPFSYRTCAADLVKSVAGDAFASIAKSFGNAAEAATKWLWDQMNAATAVDLGGASFSTVLGIVAAIAGTVAVGLFVIQVVQSVLRREPGGLARAVKGLLVAFLAGGAAIAVVNVLLAAADALCNGVVHVAVGTDPTGLGRLVLGSAATAALVGMVAGPCGAAGVLLLALAILAAVVIVYVALLIRKVLIVVTAVFAPLAFAGSLADITVAWTRRWIELTLALIFSKLILVLIFVVGYFMLVKGAGQAGTGVTQQITQVVAGVVVLALAGFAPWLALRIVHFTGEHAGQLHAMGATAAGGATAVGRMGQKAAPMMQSVTGSRSSGGGGVGGDGGGGGSGGTEGAPTLASQRPATTKPGPGASAHSGSAPVAPAPAPTAAPGAAPAAASGNLPGNAGAPAPSSGAAASATASSSATPQSTLPVGTSAASTTAAPAMGSAADPPRSAAAGAGAPASTSPPAGSDTSPSRSRPS